MSGPNEVRDLTPEEVAAGLSAGNVMLVDVREPNETQIERIPGSVLSPLSQFDPHALPDPDGRTGGSRSRGTSSAAAAGASHCAPPTTSKQP